MLLHEKKNDHDAPLFRIDTLLLLIYCVSVISNQGVTYDEGLPS